MLGAILKENSVHFFSVCFCFQLSSSPLYRVHSNVVSQSHTDDTSVFPISSLRIYFFFERQRERETERERKEGRHRAGFCPRSRRCVFPSLSLFLSLSLSRSVGRSVGWSVAFKEQTRNCLSPRTRSQFSLSRARAHTRGQTLSCCDRSLCACVYE